MPDVTEASLPDLQARLRSLELSAKEVTSLYIDRIESYSNARPKLNAVREVNLRLTFPAILDSQNSGF